MAATKKDFGLVIWVFGWLLGIATTIRKITKEMDVPFDAFERLGSPGGAVTIRRMVEVVRADWQAEQPSPVKLAEVKPALAEPNGGHPYRSTPTNGAADVVTVPDLSPAELVAWAHKKVDFTHVNPNLKAWDFNQYRVPEGQTPRYLEVRGKRYEMLTWRPGERVTTQQVRDHFAALKADGNTAAFIAWIAEKNPVGWCTSIPSDDALFFRDGDGDLCVLYFGRDVADRGLNLDDVGHDWNAGWVFVAFREICS
ncbi:MAG: hypothetical protein WCT54_05975 [Patescibacteria group bacterium]|jgi:hypothetical protein